jgi:predicted enzyme related to lactoylglutathione lyase
MEQAADFYSLLGLEFTMHRHGTGPEHYAAEPGTIVFEIYPRQKESDSSAGTRIGFRVASVDEAIRELEKAGARVVSPPKDSPWGRRAVVDDPDGHRVVLIQQT